MQTILIIGADPVIFTDDQLPPGMTRDMIRDGLIKSRDHLRAKGHAAEILWTTSADQIAGELEAAVQGRRYDVMVVGAGLRVLPFMAMHFEHLMNAILRFAPGVRLAFNSKPDDSAAAAERALA